MLRCAALIVAVAAMQLGCWWEYIRTIFSWISISICGMTLQNSFWPQFQWKNQEADRARFVFCFTGFVRTGAPQVDLITIRFGATYTDISGRFQFSLVNYVIYVHSAYMHIITYITYIIYIYIYILIYMHFCTRIHIQHIYIYIHTWHCRLIYTIK